MSPRPIRPLLAAACVLWIAAGLPCADAQTPAVSPATDTLRIWGDPAMEPVVLAWEHRFQQQHPGVRFETNLMGTDTAMPALYNGLADIALFGRESNTTENDGFLHTLQYRPLQLRLMNGSLDSEGKSYAPALFVASGNPLQKLTLAQADAAFGCGPSAGTPARTWGDLGLAGDWKDKPIHIYMFDSRSGTGLFFVGKLQGASKKMNWEIIHEFSDIRRPDGSTYAAGQQTMDALKADPYGLAVSGMQYAGAGVKALTLATTPGSPYVGMTKDSLIDGTYPLTRTTYAFVNRPPGQTVPALVRQFLEFVLSDEGRAVVAAQHGFLPLSKQDAAQQQSLLH